MGKFLEHMSVSKSGGRARNSCAQLEQGGEKVIERNVMMKSLFSVFFV